VLVGNDKHFEVFAGSGIANSPLISQQSLEKSIVCCCAICSQHHIFRSTQT
jgi:hypothetical protein